MKRIILDIFVDMRNAEGERASARLVADEAVGMPPIELTAGSSTAIIVSETQVRDEVYAGRGGNKMNISHDYMSAVLQGEATVGLRGLGQRRWLQREVELANGRNRAGRARPGGRILAGVGALLISFGRRLQGRMPESAAAARAS